MNIVPNSPEINITMSSLEIAELLEKRHDKVKQSVERLVEKGVIVQPQIEDEQVEATTPTGGRRKYTTSAYRLQKRDSYVVVAQLSPEFTARLVDRWQELEDQAASRAVTLDLDDPAQLRGLLGSYAERTQIAEAKIEYLEPKVAALDRLDTAEGNLTPRPASKILGIPERKLTKWMENNNWAFRQGGKGPLQAYVDKRNRGYLDHKLHSYTDSNTGETKTSIQMAITPKGMSRLSQVLPNGGTA